MNNQMLFFDVDGTLLDSNGILSPITIKLIQECKHNGYFIGLITARSRSKKNLQLFKQLPYDFIAFYNGAQIYVGNHLIDNNILPFKQTVMMLQTLNNDSPGTLMDVHLEPWNFSNVCGGIRHMETSEKKACTLNDLPELDIQRIRIESGILKNIPLQDYITCESSFYYTRYNDAIIVHKNANKGYVVKKASEYFNIPLKQMVAFGDDVTDIDMVKNVGIGVAMGNAIPELKESTSYVTETNDKNGVATWIAKYILQ